MMNLTKTFIFVSLLLVQGCTTVYKYHAQTNLSMPGDDKTYRAFIRWEAQESILSNTSEVESDVELRVCKKGVTVKRFSENAQVYSLAARNGDRLTHEIDAQGQLQALEQVKRTRAMDSCGELWIDDRPAVEQDLRQGGRFSLYFLCQSSNKNRYATVAQYDFEPVVKIKDDAQNAGQNLCE